MSRSADGARGDEVVLHRERPGNLWLGVALPLAAWLALVGWTARDFHGESGRWPVRELAVLAPVLLLPALAPVAVTLSKRIYHGITLTPRTLRVGRHSVPVASLDPDWTRGQAAAAAAGRLPSRVASLGTLRLPGPFRADPGRSVAGGGWGIPAGMPHVELRTRDGQVLLVAARHRTALLHALARLAPAP